MKAAIIDWITPKGQTLTPHIPRNAKIGRGFHHEHTGALLCPAGYEWANEEFVIEFMLCSLTKWMTHSRTKAKLRDSQLQVAGDLWPVFLYASYSYDAEDPWNGLLRSGLLISVSSIYYLSFSDLHLNSTQAYKHVFISPSSVDQEPKATRSGNAHIHGMQSVTKASITYIATQVSHLLQLYETDLYVYKGLLCIDVYTNIFTD